MSEFADILNAVSRAAAASAPLLPGPAQPVAAVIAAALALAGDIATAGADPVIEIERIRRIHPMLTKVEREWDARLRAKAGYDPGGLGG